MEEGKISIKKSEIEDNEDSSEETNEEVYNHLQDNSQDSGEEDFSSNPILPSDIDEVMVQNKMKKYQESELLNKLSAKEKMDSLIMELQQKNEDIQKLKTENSSLKSENLRLQGIFYWIFKNLHIL